MDRLIDTGRQTKLDRQIDRQIDREVYKWIDR